jgi:hypothetical protein
VVSSDDWSDVEATLVTLYRRAEREAIDTCDWYLADKRIRKRASQWLRAAMIVFGALGGLVPLLVGAGLPHLSASWGYAFLALAAACAAFDRFFGLSQGWARDMAAAQAIQFTLSEFQTRWAAMSHANLSPQQLDARIDHIARFADTLHRIIGDETAAWRTEFNSDTDHLTTKSLSAQRSG